MKYLISVLLMLAVSAVAEEVINTSAVAPSVEEAAAVPTEEDNGAKEELLQARTALEEGCISDAYKHAARVQVLYYRNANAMAAALYIEARADQATGKPPNDASALTELKTLYPDSVWCSQAIGEIEKPEQENR